VGRATRAGVRNGEGPGALPEGGERRAVGEEPHDRSEKARPGQHRLREHDGAARRLHHSGIGGPLIAAGPGQRDVDRRPAQMATLVHRARPASPDDEVRRRIDVAELRADVWGQGVPQAERRRHGPGALGEP
jgi:hypothetical protein